MVGVLAQRLSGSPDLYQATEREPYHSINFVTCHDGFTLADLVAYNTKHNEENGEDNRDGVEENLSWNCGIEGPTDDTGILALRERQMRNLLALLLIAQGVPMILAGDELGRTQGGNNNAYCQDNATSWVDWRLASQNAGLLEFARRLIRFRHQHPILRTNAFAGGEVRIVWHGVRQQEPDWSWESRSLAMHVSGPADDVYVMANAWSGILVFDLPPHISWRVAFDTMRDDAGAVLGDSYRVYPRSVVILSRA
jgi:glycogen operon protein